MVYHSRLVPITAAITLVLSLVTGHGRAAPLVWLSVGKDELTKQRNDFEDACRCRLAELLPAGAV